MAKFQKVNLFAILAITENVLILDIFGLDRQKKTHKTWFKKAGGKVQENELVP